LKQEEDADRQSKVGQEIEVKPVPGDQVMKEEIGEGETKPVVTSNSTYSFLKDFKV